jgi:DNA gyrase subunit A
MQSTFGCNMVALNGGRPELMNIKDMISAFVDFREEVVSRRTKFLLGKARDRAHVLVGLAIAVANIDEMIRIIRSAPDPQSARDALMGRDWPAYDMAPLVALIDDPRHPVSDAGIVRLSETQARAILDLRLQRLTALGRDEIAEELNALAVEIADYLEILRSRIRIMEIVGNELATIKAAHATPRRTIIVDYDSDVDDEDLIAREEMVVTVSHAGYIKRVPLSTYRAQRRGGKGRSGMATRDEDFVARLFVASTHAPVLFFSSRGRVYPENEAEWDKLDVMFATRDGNVRRNKLSDFVNVNRAGKIAMKLDEGDAIVDVQMCTDRDDVLLTTTKGQGIRFSVDEVRVFKGRDSTGVRGISLAKEDHVISMAILRHVDATAEERAAYIKMRRAVTGETTADEVETEVEDTGLPETSLSQERYAELSALEQVVLTISQNGYGKRTVAYEIRTTGRGGKGIVTMIVNDRNGPIVGSFPVETSDQIMLVTDGGQLIRCPIEGIRIAGRNTQGVIVFNTADDEKVVSVERVTDTGEDDEAGDAPAEAGDDAHPSTDVPDAG